MFEFLTIEGQMFFRRFPAQGVSPFQLMRQLAVKLRKRTRTQAVEALDQALQLLFSHGDQDVPNRMERVQEIGHMDFRLFDVGQELVRELNPAIALEARDCEWSGRNHGAHAVLRFHRTVRVASPLVVLFRGVIHEVRHVALYAVWK